MPKKKKQNKYIHDQFTCAHLIKKYIFKKKIHLQYADRDGISTMLTVIYTLRLMSRGYKAR